jgi:glycosyltransferase involved in cell wall biosynthesis
MKIGLVNSEYPVGASYGGIATYTYQMARALRDIGQPVRIFLKRGMHYPLDLKGIELTWVQPEQLPWYRPFGLRQFRNGRFKWHLQYAWGLYRAVERLVQTRDLDLLLAPEYNGEAHFITGRNLVPVVLGLHTPTYLVQELSNLPLDPETGAISELEKAAAQRAPFINYYSTALYNRVARDWSLTLKESFLSYHPLDLEPESGPGDPRENTLVYLGRLEVRKGLDRLLRVIRPLLAMHPDWKLKLIGNDRGDVRGETYQDRVQRDPGFDGIRHQVEFTGELARAEALPIMKKASIFLTLPDFDNYPYVMLEAMSLGLAVAATDVGGISEMVSHQKTGLLFPLHDEEQAIKSLSQLIEDKPRQRQLGEAGRKAVAWRNQPEKVARENLKIYENLLSQQRIPQG